MNGKLLWVSRFQTKNSSFAVFCWSFDVFLVDGSLILGHSGLFATSAWMDRWIRTHSGAGRLAEGFLLWCLFHKANQKPDGQPASTSTSTIIPYQSIGEAFAHGTELVWELLQVLRSRGCTRQIRSPEDVHLGCFLIVGCFFAALIFVIDWSYRWAYLTMKWRFVCWYCSVRLLLPQCCDALSGKQWHACWSLHHRLRLDQAGLLLHQSRKSRRWKMWEMCKY